VAFDDQGAKAWVLRRKRFCLCQQRERSLVLRRLSGPADEIGNGSFSLTCLLFSPPRLFLLPLARLRLPSRRFPLPFFLESSGFLFASTCFLSLLFLEPSRVLFSPPLLEMLALERRSVLFDLRSNARIPGGKRRGLVQNPERGLMALRLLCPREQIVERCFQFSGVFLSPALLFCLSLKFLFVPSRLFEALGFFGPAFLLGRNLLEQLTRIAMIGFKCESGIRRLSRSRQIALSEELLCAGKVPFQLAFDLLAALGLCLGGSDALQKLRVLHSADFVRPLEQDRRFVVAVLG
jgi:hypothetical protein